MVACFGLKSPTSLIDIANGVVEVVPRIVLRGLTFLLGILAELGNVVGSMPSLQDRFGGGADLLAFPQEMLPERFRHF